MNVKITRHTDTLPISVKPVKIIKKKKPLTNRVNQTVTDIKASNVRPKQKLPNNMVIEIENKHLLNQTSNVFKRHV